MMLRQVSLSLALQSIFQSFCVIAFLNATISLLAVRDWDTGKEKKYFFSVQVFFNNPHGAVGVGRKPI